MRIDLPLLYPITDRWITGLSHAEQVCRLIEGGATFVQLREKRLAPREFYREAEAALRVARKHGVRLIINDRVDIAFALGADGVHLGQDDLAPADARRILGEKAIIGTSTHNVAQVSEVINQPVDYVAIGPIFKTSTKENYDQILGTKGLEEVRGLVGSAALVAIGGIKPTTAQQCLNAGADSVAMISAILDDPKNISRQVEELLATLHKTQ